MAAGAQPIDASSLDLDRYDLPGLRQDINQILDLPSAIGNVFRQSLTFVVVGAALIWLVFRDRMALWALIPYMGVACSALLLAAAGVSAFFVLRKRLDATDRAADRALFTVAAMHGDLLEHQDAGGELPMREVASFLTQTVVFPVLMGSAGTMLDSASTAAGPIGWVGGQVLKRAMTEVEAHVLAALDTVDEGEVDEALAPSPQEGDGGVDSWEHLPVADLPDQIRGWYESIHRYLSRAVDGVEVLTVGGAGVTTALAVLPLLLVLALGWFVT